MAKNFIQKAIKRPGALHRALGVPQSKDIPYDKIAKAAHEGGRVGREARFALTLRKLRKG